MTRPPFAMTVTIRLARPADARRLRRVAALDSATVPHGEVLVGECDGRLLAATSVDGAGTIADPFVPTADLVELLLARAAQLRRAEESSRPPGPPRAGVMRLRRALAATTPRPTSAAAIGLARPHRPWSAG